MPPRLFVEPSPDDPDTAQLDRTSAQHLRALRLRVGAEIVAIVGPHRERRATVVTLDDGGAMLRLGDSLPPPSADPTAPLVLAVGLADLGRLDLVVEKATELGTTALWPFVAERSQIREISPARRERWQRIGRAASEQCGRTVPPSIEAAAPLAEICERLTAPRRAFVLTPSGSATPPVASASGAEIVLVVGPEGGLTPGEVATLCRSGAIPCSLGPRVLRFETAAVAVLVWASLCRTPPG